MQKGYPTKVPFQGQNLGVFFFWYCNAQDLLKEKQQDERWVWALIYFSDASLNFPPTTGDPNRWTVRTFDSLFRALLFRKHQKIPTEATWKLWFRENEGVAVVNHGKPHGTGLPAFPEHQKPARSGTFECLRQWGWQCWRGVDCDGGLWTQQNTLGKCMKTSSASPKYLEAICWSNTACGKQRTRMSPMSPPAILTPTWLISYIKWQKKHHAFLHAFPSSSNLYTVDL